MISKPLQTGIIVFRNILFAAAFFKRHYFLLGMFYNNLDCALFPPFRFNLTNKVFILFVDFLWLLLRILDCFGG